jgi:hypothetical protein
MPTALTYHLNYSLLNIWDQPLLTTQKQALSPPKNKPFHLSHHQAKPPRTPHTPHAAHNAEPQSHRSRAFLPHFPLPSHHRTIAPLPLLTQTQTSLPHKRTSSAAPRAPANHNARVLTSRRRLRVSMMPTHSIRGRERNNRYVRGSYIGEWTTWSAQRCKKKGYCVV